MEEQQIPGVNRLLGVRNKRAKGRAKPTPQPSSNPLADMNAKYCVVLDGARTRVLTFEQFVQQIGRYRHVRYVPTFLAFEDFRNLYLHRVVPAGDKFVPVGHWWLRNPARRQYAGVVFEPGQGEVVEGRLNLWRGWGVEPKPGDWSRMRAHIEEVLAKSNEDHAAYIHNWLAWAVQYPDQRAEVANVFRGGRGTGKGTLGNAMCRIFGQHAIHLSSADHLTGRFNGHLRDACLLFADESYWPGDKSAEGSLKALITEPEIAIEPKHRDVVMTKNMSHVLMASNEKWVVPAGERERRFAVFDVSEDKAQQEKWFGPLYQQLENGGYGAMLFDLLRRDLGDWHPRRIPRTQALLDQQSSTLDPFDAWWVELLKTGVLWGANPGMPYTAVSNSYDENVTNHSGYTRTVRRRCLYDQARAVSPRLKGASDHALGQYLKERGCDNRQKVMRRRGWTFPPLDQCRKKWEERFPGWVWDSDEELVTEWEGEPG